MAGYLEAELLRMMNPQSLPALLPWSFEDNKRFERLLAIYSSCDPSTMLLNIAQHFTDRRTYAEIHEQYMKLVSDVDLIERDLVPLPHYNDDFEAANPVASTSNTHTKPSTSSGGSVEKKKGTQWSDDEHRLFLLGLKRFGKGDWRSISRNFVTTRSPTQVASHAQKYYGRKESAKKERKRSSIHDISVVDDESIKGLIKRGKLSESGAKDLLRSQATDVPPQLAVNNVQLQRAVIVEPNTHFHQHFVQVSHPQLPDQTHIPEYYDHTHMGEYYEHDQLLRNIGEGQFPMQ